MAENHYSLFNDVTMPEYLKDKNSPRYYYNLLKYVGKTGQTPELVKEAIEAEEGYERRPILKEVSKKLLTQELCILAVKKDGRNIEFVPSKFLSNEIYLIAVQNNGDALCFVPEEQRTEEMCLMALESSKCGSAVEHIPKTIRKSIGIKKSYELAVQYNALALEYVPKRYITERLVKTAVLNPKEYKSFFGHAQWPIRYVPKKFLTKEILILSLQMHPESIEDFPENCITLELITSYLMGKNATMDIVKHIPWGLLGEGKVCEILKELERHGYKRNLELEQENQYTEEKNEKVEYFLQCNDQLTYCSDRENIQSPKAFLAASSFTNVLAPTVQDKIETNVYYISDIHLEHNLDLIGKERDEIKTSIGEFVKRMICEHTPQDILLVGGDVSCFLSFNYMFYQALQNYWMGKIIFVLGNHDVWNYEDTKQDRANHLSIEKVINGIEQNYQKNVYLSKPVLLENAVFLQLQDSAFGSDHNRGTCLSEEKILAADTEELRAYCKKASVIILGGLGFSGENNIFNADNGIYRYAVTRSEDIEHSKRFETVYNKLLQCAADEPVMVLTHTPMRDWSKQQYHPGWIYISGHTHQNIASLDYNGAIVLENNQVGYHGKKVQLKKFVLNHEAYDPLKNLSDGIHAISKIEYLDYNQAHDIAISRFSRTGTILALKKKSWYMFLLQNNDQLYILEGAQMKRAIHNAKFYYENIESYCNNVIKILGPFCKYEQKIAELVKQVGGEGRIHGCIIDFDYYNHVFVNPLDGSLTPYFATSVTYKLVYPDFAELKSHKKKNGLLDEGTEEKSLTIVEQFAINELNRYRAKNTEEFDSVVYDTTIYKYSDIVKSVQYITDKHTVRVWRDEFLNHKGMDSLEKTLKSIPVAEVEDDFEEPEKNDEM